jgi:hypothetical protein
MSSSKVDKDLENLIRDTNATVKDSLRQRQDAAKLKLDDIRVNAIEEAELIRQMAKKEERSTELRDKNLENVEDYSDSAREKVASAEHDVNKYKEELAAVEKREKADEKSKNEEAELKVEFIVVPLIREIITIESVEPEKGVIERIGEKLHDTKEFIADTAWAGLEKVEHLGSAIKDTVIGVKEKTEEEFVEEKDRVLHAVQHLKEGLSLAYADLTEKKD